MAGIRLSVSAKANASGSLTAVFPTPPATTTYAVSVVIPAAPTVASAGIYITGQLLLPVLGSQPSAVIEYTNQQVLSVQGTGFEKTTAYQIWIIGQQTPGPPRGLFPMGPSTLVNLTSTTVTNNTTTVHLIPVVTTVGILSVRVKLLGTTTAVAIVPATRTQAYFPHCKIGVVIWGTPTNTGKRIYLGDHAGGVSVTDSSIPAGVTKLVGSFSAPFGNAVTMRVSGKTGDYANVWAA